MRLSRAFVIAGLAALMIVLAGGGGSGNQARGSAIVGSLNGRLNDTINNKAVIAEVDKCVDSQTGDNLEALTKHDLDLNPRLLYVCRINLDEGDRGTEQIAYQLTVKKGGCWDADYDILPTDNQSNSCTGLACSAGAPEGGLPADHLSDCASGFGK